MARAAKPLMLATKGQRNKGKLDLTDLERHYRDVFAGLFIWDGLPEGCPKDYIEGFALWETPGAGCKKVKALGHVISGIHPANFTVYGRPYQWTPSVMQGLMPNETLADFFTPSSEPCLYIGRSMRSQIEPYVEIMRRALAVLNQNIFALSQPVMINGLPSANLKGLIMESEIMDGETFIQIAGREAVQPEVLDLKVTDHTQNLVSTVDWCDARILETMMSSNGVEKSSGITTMETVSGVQSIMQQFEMQHELRKAWADDVNDRFRLDLTVRPGKGIESLMKAPAEAPEGDGNDEEDAEAEQDE